MCACSTANGNTSRAWFFVVLRGFNGAIARPSEQFLRERPFGIFRVHVGTCSRALVCQVRLTGINLDDAMPIRDSAFVAFLLGFIRRGASPFLRAFSIAPRRPASSTPNQRRTASRRSPPAGLLQKATILPAQSAARTESATFLRLVITPDLKGGRFYLLGRHSDLPGFRIAAFYLLGRLSGSVTYSDLRLGRAFHAE